MKKFLTFILLSAVAFPDTFANPDCGRIFIRTLRGESTAVRTDGNVTELDVNDTINAKNVQITGRNGDFVSFALSNRSGAVFKGEGSIIFNSFKHKSRVSDNINAEEELIPSDIILHLEKGTLIVSRAQPRPSSKFIISTPFGEFHCIGKEIKICVSENSATAYALRNPFNFFPIGSNTPEYIGVGYSISAHKNGANISLTRQSIDNDSENAISEFNSAENAWRNTIFTQEVDGLLYGKRILPKGFHLKSPVIPRKR